MRSRRVGGHPVTIAEVQNRAQQDLRVAARQQPGVTMPQFLAAVGGVPALVEQVVGGAVLTRWAEKHGLVAGKRLVDGEISSIPAFQGPAGTFDETQMNAILSPAADDLRAAPRRGARRSAPPPAAVAAHHGHARAERAARPLCHAAARQAAGRDRHGAGEHHRPARADRRRESRPIYQSHLAAYSLPDRRVVRYAPIGPDTLDGSTAADRKRRLPAYYKANAATYAASETRTVSQVVLPDANAAQGVRRPRWRAARSFAKAAADAGFAAGDISLGAVTRDALAKSASPAVAAAAFASGERRHHPADQDRTRLRHRPCRCDHRQSRRARSTRRGPRSPPRFPRKRRPRRSARWWRRCRTRSTTAPISPTRPSASS